jgi:protein-tyrosine phosphatase
VETPGAGSGQFDVVFVCTGNRFRSVVAEATFGAATEGLPVRVASYGTLDIGPAGPLPVAALEARSFGLDVSTHVARCVTNADLREASLVVGFEAEHVVTAVNDAGARPERAFILLELIDLLDSVETAGEGDAVSNAVEYVARAHARLRAESRRRSVPEIEDPVGMPASAQHAIGRGVYHATNRLALQLFGRTGPHQVGPDGAALPRGA